MSASQLSSFIQSEANLKTLEGNSSLKAAALANLQTIFDSGTASTSDKEIAANTYANIAIETVPSAEEFSSDFLVAVAANSSSYNTAAGALSLISSALPSTISQALSSKTSTPPQSFIDLVSAYGSANTAYQALGSTVGSTGYASGSGISANQANGIAVNAVISALVSTAQPVGATTTAAALWNALLNPSNASSYVTLPTYDTITTTGSNVANLIQASSLGATLNQGGK